MTYELVIGNVGTVRRGLTRAEAMAEAQDYAARIRRDNAGRAEWPVVVMSDDGEIVEEIDERTSEDGE